MATINGHIPDFDDFDRYYSGRMSAAEQRLLEGRMLDEPLVAEAYEGFLAWRAEHSDVSDLRADLHKRLNARVSGANRKTMSMWVYASAASVLLALFSYWLVFLRDNQVEMQRPAGGATQKEQPVDESIPATGLPAPAQAFVQPAERPKLTNSKPDPATTPASIPKGEKHETDGVAAFEAETAIAAVDTDESVRKEAAVVPADSGLIKTGPSQSAPEPDKALAAPGSAKAVGKSLAARAKAKPSQPHFVSKKAADTNFNAKPEMLNEVLVTGASVQAKRSDVTIPADVERPAPVPVEGWEPYRAYLDSSTGSAVAAGQVVVTFIVNPTGALSGFRAKGVGELQSEAIRIVKEGPSWLPARTKVGAVAAIAEIRLQFRQSH